MSDIHIGKIRQTRQDKGELELIYHIPIIVPVDGIVPTLISAIAKNLDQTEIDALAAGTLAEITRSMTIFNNQTNAEITIAIKEDFLVTKAELNKQYSFEHKFYGAHFNVTV